MPPAKNAAQKVLEEVGKFVTANKGEWDHSDWEGFLGQIEKIGFNLNDEVKRNVGNLLEDAKALYHKLPEPAAQKKTVKKAVKKTAKKAS